MADFLLICCRSGKPTTRTTTGNCGISRCAHREGFSPSSWLLVVGISCNGNGKHALEADEPDTIVRLSVCPFVPVSVCVCACVLHVRVKDDLATLGTATRRRRHQQLKCKCNMGNISEEKSTRTNQTGKITHRLSSSSGYLVVWLSNCLADPGWHCH